MAFCNTSYEHPFILLDVGCHGGLHPLAQVFAPSLLAHGFDLEAGEIARLNAAPDKPAGTHFHHIRLCGPSSEKEAAAEENAHPVSPFNSDFHARTASFRACAILGLYAAQEKARSGSTTTAALPRTMTLDAFAAEQALPYVDFIKTDTDGFDIHILRGSEGLFQKTVLGVLAECSLNGVQSRDANLFRHTDALLQRHGFSLFDMQLQRYARAALPLPFVTADPAQTEKGQVNWCDALYLRDIGAPHYEEQTGFTPAPHQIIKLITMHRFFGFPDCAAEIILKYKTVLNERLDTDALLEALVPQEMGALSYGAYIATFEHLMRIKKPYALGRIKLK